MDFLFVADPSPDSNDNFCLSEIDITLGLLGDFQHATARGKTIDVYRDRLNNRFFAEGAVAVADPFCSATTAVAFSSKAICACILPSNSGRVTVTAPSQSSTFTQLVNAFTQFTCDGGSQLHPDEAVADEH